MAGSDITLKLVEIRDLTSAGCQGGPRGCPDGVVLEVSGPDWKRELRLDLAHTEEQHRRGIDQGVVDGHRITLRSVRRDRATLVVEPQ